MEHKVIKAEEWFETGDISSSLKKYEYLKEENEELKELKELRHLHKMRDYADDGVPCIMNESGRDLFESTKAENRKLLVKNLKLNKDNRDLSLAIMAYENTEQDDIQTIEECKEENKKLKEVVRKQGDQLEIHRKATIHEHTSCYEGRMMLVKTLWEKEEDWRKRIDLDFPFINKEIANLKKENKRLEDGNKSLQKQMKELREDTETYIRETYGWEGFRCPQRGTDGFPRLERE